MSEGLLKHIEERTIIFVEDGTDLRTLTDAQSNGAPKDETIKWQKFPKKACINVNWYIAKYNFEIARKMRGTQVERIPQTEK